MASAASRPVPLAGSAAPFAAQTAAVDSLTASTSVTIQVWLRPQVAAAERFATAVSTPGPRVTSSQNVSRRVRATFGGAEPGSARWRDRGHDQATYALSARGLPQDVTA